MIDVSRQFDKGYMCYLCHIILNTTDCFFSWSRYGFGKCVSFANYLSICLHIILRRLPSLLSHQMHQKIHVHREVLWISIANILPYECHVVSALNYGCACTKKKLFTSKYFLWQRTEWWIEIEEGADRVESSGRCAGKIPDCARDCAEVRVRVRVK